MLHRKRFLTLVAAGVLVLTGVYFRLQSVPRAYAAAAEKKDEAPPAFRTPTAEERKAATAAIEAQLKAFKADDYEKAMKYQSDGLKENFDSPAEFRQMMRGAYPQFANYKSVTFGDARCNAKGDQMEIKVTVKGQDGVTVRASYLMVKEEGEYRVGGVATQPKSAPQDQA